MLQAITVSSVPQSEALLNRFFAKVRKTDDCWLWTGRINPGGSGQMRIGSKSHGKQGGMRIDVHRLAHLWFTGPIPDGYEVDHLCRVPHCVNPTHLEAVPPTVNQQRAQRWRARDKLRADALQRARSARHAPRVRAQEQEPHERPLSWQRYRARLANG